MNKSYLKIAAGCAALTAGSFFTTALYAQMEPTPTPTPPTAVQTKLSHSDKSFLKKAAKAGMAEVAISQAVLDHLTNPQVKSFAQQMIVDHTAANNELMTLAQEKNLEIPATDDSSLTDDWSKKTGDVDKDYIKKMVSDHEDAVDLFEKAATSDNPDVASFAQKILPTIQHHLTMAKDLKKTLE